RELDAPDRERGRGPRPRPDRPAEEQGPALDGAHAVAPAQVRLGVFPRQHGAAGSTKRAKPNTRNNRAIDRTRGYGCDAALRPGVARQRASVASLLGRKAWSASGR